MEAPRSTAATAIHTNAGASPDTYDLTGKSLLTAVLILLSAVLVLLFAHSFARWYLARRIRRRRGRRRPLTFPAVAHTPPHPGGDQGLDACLLSSLPVLPFSATSDDYGPDECAVCLCEFESDDGVRVLPRCAHTFHVECIDMWFYSHSTCPLCRSTVDTAQADAPPPPDLRDLCRNDVDAEAVASSSSSDSTSSSSSHLMAWEEVRVVIDRAEEGEEEAAAEEEKGLGGWITAIKSILNWELGFQCGCVGGGGDLEMGEAGTA